MKGFIRCLQFLTRFYLPFNIDTTKEDIRKTAVYFSLAGFCIGLFNAVCFCAAEAIFDGALPVVAAMLANVCITGGLHMDGLADTCDGIFSARKKERILEIMRDSRIGTNGALALIFDMLIRFLAIESIESFSVRVVTIILAPVVGRGFITLLMYKEKYARESDGLGDIFIGKLTLVEVVANLAIMSALVSGGFTAVGIKAGSIVLLWVLLAAVLYQRYIKKILGGMTGDTLGGGLEIFEIVFICLCTLI